MTLTAKSAPRTMLGAVAKTISSFGRWYQKFEWQGAHDECHTALTSDGWELALYRYRPHGEIKPYPLICSHGMAGTHLIFDLHPDYSLARYLSQAGYDTWLVDLRGRGDSWPSGGMRSKRQWNFDDFSDLDLPAATARVCQLTDKQQVFWLGMEMSGQALYAANIMGKTQNIRGGVTFGSPVLTSPDAQIPGVTAPPQVSWRGRVPFRTGSRLAGPILAYGRSSQLESSFRSCNVDPIVPARYFRNGIPDESTHLVKQFRHWVDNNTMCNELETVVYSQRLSEADLPLLLIAAAHDLQRPCDSVAATYEQLGSKDKTFIKAGTAEGFSVDYGHDDLLTGLASPQEIYPLIERWLDKRSIQ